MDLSVLRASSPKGHGISGTSTAESFQVSTSNSADGRGPS